LFAAGWVGLEPAAGRYFLLGAASLSAVGYEHDRSDPVIGSWNELPLDGHGGAAPARGHRGEARR
jgi:probable phosphoglycerate mutase